MRPLTLALQSLRECRCVPVIGAGSAILGVKVAQQGVCISVPDLRLPAALPIVPADTLLIWNTVRTKMVCGDFSDPLALSVDCAMPSPSLICRGC